MASWLRTCLLKLTMTPTPRPATDTSLYEQEKLGRSLHELYIMELSDLFGRCSDCFGIEQDGQHPSRCKTFPKQSTVSRVTHVQQTSANVHLCAQESLIVFLHWNRVDYCAAISCACWRWGVIMHLYASPNRKACGPLAQTTRLMIHQERDCAMIG